MDLNAGMSMRRLARMAGALYLVNIVFGAFAIGAVPAMLFVPGDPAATAHNIQAHELVYRLGIAAHAVVVMTNVGLDKLGFFAQAEVRLQGLCLPPPCGRRPRLEPHPARRPRP